MASPFLSICDLRVIIPVALGRQLLQATPFSLAAQQPPLNLIVVSGILGVPGDDARAVWRYGDMRIVSADCGPKPAVMRKPFRRAERAVGCDRSGLDARVVALLLV